MLVTLIKNTMDLNKTHKNEIEFLVKHADKNLPEILRMFANEYHKKKLFIHVVSISLLKKYMQHVEKCEGVNFVSDIGMSWSGIEFNKEEKDLLEKLDKEIEESNE